MIRVMRRQLCVFLQKQARYNRINQELYSVARQAMEKQNDQDKMKDRVISMGTKKNVGSFMLFL